MVLLQNRDGYERSGNLKEEDKTLTVALFY